MRLDPNLYAKVALQKIVFAEDGAACEDFIRAMRQITETREWDPVLEYEHTGRADQQICEIR